MAKFFAITLIFINLCFSYTLVYAQNLGVQSPWVREINVKNAQYTAYAYMRFNNRSKQVKTIKKITSLEFKRVEIHKTVAESGIARMSLLYELKIPARGHINLAPGGLHLRLTQGKREFSEGDIIHFTLHFADKSQQKFSARVQVKNHEASHILPH